jgi:hypothetical protein
MIAKLRFISAGALGAGTAATLMLTQDPFLIGGLLSMIIITAAAICD